jgi:hypothetical protein
MWRHYNLLEADTYTKYITYVDRFKEVFQTPDLKLFLYIQSYGNESIEEMVDFNEYLLDSITNYRFICIKCSTVKEKTFEFRCSYDKDNLYIYDLEVSAYKDEIEEDDLKKIKSVMDVFLLEPKYISPV